MTDSEVEYHLDNLYAMFGDRVPNPEHNPKCFAYYVKLYKHLVRLIKLHGEKHG